LGAAATNSETAASNATVRLVDAGRIQDLATRQASAGRPASMVVASEPLATPRTVRLATASAAQLLAKVCIRILPVFPWKNGAHSRT